MFDNCTQNWFAVAFIIEDVLKQLKQMHSGIQEAFQKSESLDIGKEKKEEKEFYRQGCERGWALKKPKATVRFTKSVKDFLNEIFRKGEETGQKLNPAEVSSQLRNMRSTDGNKMFHQSEWLTTQQITSYFS